MRGDLTDEEWTVIDGLLPAERGCWSRPTQDNRRFLNGMASRSAGRLPLAQYARAIRHKWNSVYIRFRRWAEQGVWDALLEMLVELGPTDDWPT